MDENNEQTTTITTPAIDDCLDFNSHKCNSCNGAFICVNPKYCPHCGKKIVTLSEKVDNMCETCAHFPRPIYKDDYSSEIVCDWKDGGICDVDNEYHKPSQCACNFYIKTHYL